MRFSRPAWGAPKAWGASGGGATNGAAVGHYAAAAGSNGAAGGVPTDRFRKDEGEDYGDPDAEDSDFKTASGGWFDGLLV